MPNLLHTHPALGLTVVATEMELPPGHWYVSGATPDAVRQVFVIRRSAPDGAVDDWLRHRAAAAGMP